MKRRHLAARSACNGRLKCSTSRRRAQQALLPRHSPNAPASTFAGPPGEVRCLTEIVGREQWGSDDFC
jgi:hypothetical protein